MKEFKQSIYPELVDLGASRNIEGVIEETSYNVGDMCLKTPAGISYNINLTNTGDAILLQGDVYAHACTECARCLEAAEIDICGDVEGYFLYEGKQELSDFEEDEFELISDDGKFDISSSILAALVDATPFVILCKQDCKGLCLHCGANLNKSTCDCSDEIDSTNPFSVLADLKFDDDKN